jgi:hypothetical protein
MAVMQVFLGERQNLMVEPLAFGVFRIVGLSDDASLAGIASTLVKTLRTGGRLAVGVGDTLIQVGWGDAQATITTAGVTTQVGFDDVPHLLQQSLDVAG